MLKHYGAVVGIVGGVTLLQLANAIFAVILPLQLAVDGYSGTTAGLVTTAYGLGFLAGCAVAHRLIRSVGHIRAFAVLAAVCSVTSLVFGASQVVAVWFLLRLAMGFCQAGLFTVVEGWLSAATPSRSRGGVLSFYLVTTKLAIVGGQLVLARADTMSLVWFDVASAVFALALLPVALTRTPQPPAPRRDLLGPRGLYRLAPAAVAGCLASGLLGGAVLGLTPIFGTRLGLPVPIIVWLLSAIQLGSFVCQWPIGRLSDSVDRRWVIAGCATAVALVSPLIAWAGADRGWLLPLFFLYGAGSLTFYAVSIAHAGDLAEPDQMVGVSGGSLLVWAAGAAIGPTATAPLVDLLGPPGLFLYTFLVATPLAAFIFWRMTRRAPVPPEQRDGFVDLPTTSPALVEIDPRVRERAAR